MTYDVQAVEEFDEFFDEVMPIIKIGSLEYSPSRVLREVDPIAYQMEVSNWEEFRQEEEL